MNPVFVSAYNIGSTLVESPPSLLGDSMEIEGHYTFECVGPANEQDRLMLIGFLDSNPDFIEEHGDRCNIEAAKFLGIKLIKKWDTGFDNTVMTEGKNLLLSTGLQGSAYTVTGPFMGLISSVSYTAIAAADTAAQIDGTNQWKEAGSSTFFPLYTTPRKTLSFSAPSGGVIATSAAASFAIITTGGTIKGAFVIFGSGASSTIANTSGTLLSAGLFVSGDRAVLVGDTVNVSYSLTLS